MGRPSPSHPPVKVSGRQNAWDFSTLVWPFQAVPARDNRWDSLSSAVEGKWQWRVGGRGVGHRLVVVGGCAWGVVIPAHPTHSLICPECTPKVPCHSPACKLNMDDPKSTYAMRCLALPSPANVKPSCSAMLTSPSSRLTRPMVSEGTYSPRRPKPLIIHK